MASINLTTLPAKFRLAVRVGTFVFFAVFGALFGVGFATKYGVPGGVGALGGAALADGILALGYFLTWAFGSEEYVGESTDDEFIVAGRRRLNGRRFIAFRADITGASCLDEAVRETGWHTTTDADTRYPKLGLWDADPRFAWGLRGIQPTNADAVLVRRFRQSKLRTNLRVTAAVAAELKRLTATGRLVANVDLSTWRNETMPLTEEMNTIMTSRGMTPEQAQEFLMNVRRTAAAVVAATAYDDFDDFN